MYEILDVPESLQVELNQIANCNDSEWLLNQLKESLSITVNHVIKVAALLRRLDENGVDIDIEFSLIPMLRKVAYGQVLPELIVTLQGDNQLLAKAVTLSIPEQRAIARNLPVQVMISGGGHRKVPPLSLTRRELRQVIGRGKIRTPAEQIGWLNDEREKNAAKQGVSENEIKVDRKRKGIIVNGAFISSMDMVRFLGDLNT